MNLSLKQVDDLKNATITITGSKSETNRMLLLQALYPNITLENISNSDDSKVMQNALQSIEKQIDIHHAGTAMRFLTAFFAIQNEREVTISGSSRMKERPIRILIDALNRLGANIIYTENDGFPPLKIIGKKLENHKITLAANISSQYISALLLIAPQLEKGLEINLEGKITSVPYIKMTLKLLENIGVFTEFVNQKITIQPKKEIENYHHVIESDWSSASYFYSIISLSKIGTSITLKSFKTNSLQADAVVVSIYEKFGVKTVFSENSITISKEKVTEISHLNYDFSNCPDIAQTVAVSCFGLGISCHFTGLHTLKIKETDRLLALQKELSKLGADIEISNDSFTMKPSNIIHDHQTISTYQDHRMAMAFAPLMLKTNITIENAEVVSKSYPSFWEDLGLIGCRGSLN